MGASEQIPSPASHELCARCKQALSFQDVRCPNCGQPVSGFTRNLPLVIGVGGVGAILFVVLLMWLVVHNEDVVNRPVPVDEETAAHQSGTLPETKTSDKEPPAPEKAPPLNQ
jgi:hypothetical protein